MRKITRALGMIHPIPDKLYLKLAYRLEFGEKLDLEEPATFNQKLQWIKLNGATFRFSHLADKSQAREHVEKVLGPEYLIPLLGLYDDPNKSPGMPCPPSSPSSVPTVPIAGCCVPGRGASVSRRRSAS